LARFSEPMLPDHHRTRVDGDSHLDLGSHSRRKRSLTDSHRELHLDGAGHGPARVVVPRHRGRRRARGMPSPMNSSMVPWCFVITSTIAAR
jgi:hypothetical protein